MSFVSYYNVLYSMNTIISQLNSYLLQQRCQMLGIKVVTKKEQQIGSTPPQLAGTPSRGQLFERTELPINRLIDVTFRVRWKTCAVVFFGCVFLPKWTFCAENATLFCFVLFFSPSARPGHLCVGADGSSWTVQSPGGGTHTQWVSTALSVYAVPSQQNLSSLMG